MARGRPTRFTSTPPTRTRSGRRSTKILSKPRPKPKIIKTLPSRPKQRPPTQIITRPKPRPKPPRTTPTPTRPTTRPTRVTVSSPSGSGKTLTVSSRSSLVRGRRKKVKPKGLRSKPRPERKQPPPTRKFGSDFDIFRVSSVGRGQDLRSVTTKTTTRTDRAGKKKRSGVPQTIQFVSDLKKPRATARTSEQRGQRIGSSRSPLNTRSSELKREFGQASDRNPFVEGLFEIPLFVPRQAGKAIEETVEFVSSRVSKKPLPEKDRAFGSDFNILNFFD